MSPLEPEEMGPLVALCRYYCLADRLLPETLPPLERAVALAELGFRHHHLEQARPSPAQLEGLRRAFDDWRIRPLPIRRRELLLFVTGAALARLEARPEEARRLLEQALAISELTSQRSSWEPWEGPRPEELARRRLVEMPEELSATGDDPDPSGDPVEVAGVHTIEAAKPRGDSLPEFAAVAQILDGLDHWEAVVQDHLELKLGLFARTGRPDLARLAGESWSVTAAPEIWEAFGVRAA